jgi:hypothetical protein
MSDIAGMCLDCKCTPRKTALHAQCSSCYRKAKKRQEKRFGSLTRDCPCGKAISIFRPRCKKCFRREQAEDIAELKRQVAELGEIVETLIKLTVK